MNSNIQSTFRSSELGNGATFWALVSQDNESRHRLKSWRIELSQPGTDWSSTIRSDDPFQKPFARNLSGKFRVRVYATLHGKSEERLVHLPESSCSIRCSSRCAAMIGIRVNSAGTAAHFWTVSDAHRDQKVQLLKRYPQLSRFASLSAQAQAWNR